MNQHNDGLQLQKRSESDVCTYDDSDMRRMGKRQELRRAFRFASSLGFATCVMGTWEILLVSNTQSLISGGLAGLFWSLCWVYIGQLFVILSLAEMSSMAPTAGGQYHWVSELAPKNSQKFLSYVSGWLATVSWQSIITVDCYLVGTIIQGMIALNVETYTHQRWHGTILIIVSVVCIALFNIFAAKYLPSAEGFFACAHVFIFIAVFVAMLVLPHESQSARAVFSEFTDNGAGWGSMPLTVMVGQVPAIFAVLGSDSVAHMSEEITNAGVIVPKSMVWSYILNAPLAIATVVAYLFSIKNIDDAISSPTGFPFIYVFSTVADVKWASVLTAAVLALVIIITTSSFTSTSRQTFAFARDNGLPFSKWLSDVHPRWRIPVNSIVFSGLYTTTLSLINVGSTVAFNAIVSLSTSALMGTYVVSIGSITLKRIRKEKLPDARWSLGRYGLAINGLGLTYACWSFFWSFWPNSFNTTAVNFNWAFVLLVGFMGFAVVFYYLHARSVFEGPVVKVIDPAH